MIARRPRAAGLASLALLAQLALVLSLGACASGRVRAPDGETAAPPPALVGTFTDDYGGSHTVSRDAWLQGTTARYEIVEWVPASRYLVARNASDHPTAPGNWMRIDWVLLDGMPPWRWAFCFSAYDAPTREDAAATRIAKPETPRTGCNGFPYSRLKPASP